MLWAAQCTTTWAPSRSGSWPLPEMLMTGGMLAAPDSLAIQDSQLHFHFGNNWMANKGGNTAYQLDYAKREGGKVIIVEPWLNQTAQAVADEWVPIVPGTDTAFWHRHGLPYDREQSAGSGISRQVLCGFRCRAHARWSRFEGQLQRLCAGHLRQGAEDPRVG